ncbi:16S rRNA (cytosine(967)-C(5))-methyltransferase RsmB [Lacticaseibacillus thailandensis]|uniref:16S rRNA (cytosine(967)-C(5))-methyltransferase n=1 Tax=Lacticaseibacillus thailandensis DSM 22698 = JCM 13996 TaxID=1423810 RepID=A0A0R2C975_9LACO|nr:16S rRNA (cytosine(967)-C(5))-methyltransferase RsmB [Lacticaseibacillus thailandensis]KRM88248.1 16S rRNA methyltransferase B [Lacticaseibacillus thailandensis DSM 22698 = JCM 13996]
MEKNNVRLLAVEVLSRVGGRGGYSNLTVDSTIRQGHLADRDAALLTNIVYGVIQHQLTLDYYLAPFVGRRELDPWVRQLLRTAVYQMHYLDKVPERAIFFDSTEIAKLKGHTGIAKFVTAILRNIQRKGLRDVSAIQDPVKRLSVAASVPTWLVQKLFDQWGELEATALLNSINSAPHASARVNRTLTTREALVTRLQDRFPDVRPSTLATSGVVAPGGHLAGTPEFADGLLTMQDESSQLVAPSLALQPGDQVLDACAAPGGKTTHIAEWLDPAAGGHVTALDLHPHKVRLIEQNATRMRLADRVSARTLDARQAVTTFGEQSFDKVLVDAPCSGLGLMRRKPEIKYDKTIDDVQNLARVQAGILDAVAPAVKVGGRLTYSTCTITHEENQDVVAAFLQRHGGFRQVAVPTLAPVTHNHAAPALQILPHDYGSDGFFIACLERVE